MSRAQTQVEAGYELFESSPKLATVEDKKVVEKIMGDTLDAVQIVTGKVKDSITANSNLPTFINGVIDNTKATIAKSELEIATSIASETASASSANAHRRRVEELHEIGESERALKENSLIINSGTVLGNATNVARMGVIRDKIGGLRQELLRINELLHGVRKTDGTFAIAPEAKNATQIRELKALKAEIELGIKQEMERMIAERGIVSKVKYYAGKIAMSVLNSQWMKDKASAALSGAETIIKLPFQIAALPVYLPYKLLSQMFHTVQGLSKQAGGGLNGAISALQNTAIAGINVGLGATKYAVGTVSAPLDFGVKFMGGTAPSTYLQSAIPGNLSYVNDNPASKKAA